MYDALAQALSNSNDDDDIRVVRLSARGDMFSAGNDIQEFIAGLGAPGANAEDLPVIKFLFALARAQKPLVATVQGDAVWRWRDHVAPL